MSLTNGQRNARTAIYNYGIENGHETDDIQIALNVAFIESTVGLQLINSSSSAYGLFQYTIPTWNDRHSGLGTRQSESNQIQAFYTDLDAYKTRFANGKNSGAIPASLSFPEYVYVKHHDGWNATNFDESLGRAKYNQKINGSEPGYLDVEISGPCKGNLAIDPDICVDACDAAEQDVVGCIKQGEDNAYIDYFLEYFLTDTERQNIVEADPSGGIYIYDHGDEP